MLDLLDHLSRGEFPMPKRRTTTDTYQTCDLSHLQFHFAVEQKSPASRRLE